MAETHRETKRNAILTDQVGGSAIRYKSLRLYSAENLADISGLVSETAEILLAICGLVEGFVRYGQIHKHPHTG